MEDGHLIGSVFQSSPKFQLFGYLRLHNCIAYFILIFLIRNLIPGEMNDSIFTQIELTADLHRNQLVAIKSD